jgi:hypothetical protein
MNETKIVERIKNILDSAPIDLLNQIKAEPVEQMLKHDEITSQKRMKSVTAKMIPLAAAAILLLMFGTWRFQYFAAYTEIYMDINPSIELVTNRKSQVIDIKSGNTEGEELIKNISYKGKNYLEVTSELLDELIEGGYLSESKELMLLSVYNKNMEKEASHLKELDQHIHEYLTSKGIDTVILGQKIEKTNTLRDYAKDYGISLSKMTFIRNLIILHPELEIEELVELSLQELVERSRQLGIDLKGIIESQDWDKIPEETDKPEKPEVVPTEPDDDDDKDDKDKGKDKDDDDKDKGKDKDDDDKDDKDDDDDNEEDEDDDDDDDDNEEDDD